MGPSAFECVPNPTAAVLPTRDATLLRGFFQQLCFPPMFLPELIRKDSIDSESWRRLTSPVFMS